MWFESNKLFTIVVKKFTVASSSSDNKKFIALKPQGMGLDYINNVISVGSKLFVLQSGKPLVWCYDVDEEKWSTKNLKCDINYFSCVKLPWC